MSDIENIKNKEWTCSNCGHQSPFETFDCLAKLQKENKELKEFARDVVTYMEETCDCRAWEYPFEADAEVFLKKHKDPISKLGSKK